MNKLKKFLSLLCAAAMGFTCLLSFAACADQSDKEVLRVYNWEDYIDPDMARHIEENLETVLAEGRALVESHYNGKNRVQTAAVRMMEHYLVYVEYYAKMMREKALGNDEEAMKIFEQWRDDFSKREIYMETCYDQHLMFAELGRMASRKADSVLTAFYV